MNSTSKFFFVLLAAAPAFAQQPAPEGQKRGVAAGESVTAVATVEAINQETREVTLRRKTARWCRWSSAPKRATSRRSRKGTA